ncbi:hypothetical protein CHS0354_041510 [Potamilus streckersoni]|uniref:C-type lectin domain-containing protein n=1 Tax=Potamilus streckersoni TaxID=2493646 RepID=A0AAE0TB03_9BIVA|nr:hypothetical protein CHS0354_041510 [Potamilus streckersoni]
MHVQLRLLTPMLVLYTCLLTSTCSKEGGTQNEICVFANAHVYNTTYFIMEKHAARWDDVEHTCIQYGMQMATAGNEVISKVEAAVRQRGQNTTFRTWIGYSKGGHRVPVVQWVGVGLATAFVLVLVLLILLVVMKRRTRRVENGLQLSGQFDRIDTFQEEQSSQVSGTEHRGAGNSIIYVEAYNRAYDTFRPNNDSRYIYQEPELGMESEDASEVMNFSSMVDLDIANDVTESPKRNSLNVDVQNEILSRSQDHVYAKGVKIKL